MIASVLFVSGTDTGVGKTHISCRILRELRGRDIDAVGFKPVCCGDRDDAVALAEACSMSDLDAINPIWFQSPLAPFAAARLENRPFDRRAILDGLDALRSRHSHVLIEGAGGWDVPLTASETMADLAVTFGAPVLVVAADRLGALNHTLLTTQAIRNRDLECAGVVLNRIEESAPDDLAAQTNLEVLKTFLPEIPIVVTEFQEKGESKTIDGDLVRRLGLA